MLVMLLCLIEDFGSFGVGKSSTLCCLGVEKAGDFFADDTT
jgi:hypothetical protein